MDQNILELFYNHTDICKVLYNGEIAKAEEILHEKEELLLSLPDDNLLLNQRIFLSSLNKSLYYYYLHISHLSLSNVCYNNFPETHPHTAQTEIVPLAMKICFSYYKAYTSAICMNPHVTQACQYIQEHLDENLSLDTVSRHVFISRCHLSQLFQEHLKQGFSEYVTESRISQAKHLLIHSQQPLEQVAQQCGYTSASYFATVFRKSTQFSPREFRKKFQNI